MSSAKISPTASPFMVLWKGNKKDEPVPNAVNGQLVSVTETPSMEDSSNWFSYVFMTYLDTLFAKGYQRTLELADLGGISKQDRSDLLHHKFEKEYQVECEKPLAKRSLWGILWRTVSYWKLFLGLILFGVSAALQFGPVLILTRLVRYFQGVEYFTTAELWVLVCLLMVFPVVGAVALAHSNAIMAHLGAQIRNTLIGVIYRKALRISPYRRQTISTGRIITMFSDDTNQIRNFLFFMNNFVCAPLQIGACLYLIYQQVGASTFVGLGYAILTMPLSGMVFGIVFKYYQVKKKETDSRVKLMNEILNGIRIIKYYAWENAFIQKISQIRFREVALLAKSGYIFNSVFGVFLLGAPQIQTVLIFLCYVGLGHQLDAAKAFTTLTLFGLMTSPFIFLPFGLNSYNQSLLSMKRIMEFLDAEDLEAYVTYNATGSEANVVVEFQDTCLSWTPKDEEPSKDADKKDGDKKDGDKKDGEKKYEAVATSEQQDDLEAAKKDDSATATAIVPAEDFTNKAIHTLRNVNLKVKQGQLVGIVGTVGSGKSSMLTSLLGEMHLRSGSVMITKNADGSLPSIAYCDQRPWIVNATVKDNILFGKEYDADRFNKAIFAACMTDDLKILSAGVETEIGERGINLSGGQKARVALARAVYNNADIYLLDDPLSAVDAHVGEHIFSKCIKGDGSGSGLEGKTRFLVTHHLHVLPQCDMIVILDSDGTVKASGSYDEIMNSGIDVSKYLAIPEEEEDSDDEEAVGKDGKKDKDGKKKDKKDKKKKDEEKTVAEKEQEATAEQESTDDKTDNTTTGIVDKVSSKKDANGTTASKKEAADKDKGALITKEERSTGDVSFSTYWLFVKYGGPIIFGFVIFCQLSSQVLNIEANFWLSDWGKETTIDNYVYQRDMSQSRTFHWFRGYAGMQMASIFFMATSRMFLNYHRTEAGRTFHQKLLQTVLFLPVSFFDVTPIGRILNRFSQDMATIDDDMAQSLSQVIGMGGGVLGSLGAIAGSTKGTFLILAVPLGYLYSHFQTYFRKSNTAIARLEAVSRSPIYADFSQTLSGTSTIRAYGQQDRFIDTLEDYANRNTVPGIFQQIAGQWLAIRLDFLGALIMFFMGALTLSLRHENFIPAGYLALGLSYSIQLTSLLKMAVRVSATLEAQFNAVERVKFYVEMEGVESSEGAVHHGAQSSKKESSKRKPVPTIANTPANNDGDIEMALTKKPLPLTMPPENWPAEGKIVFDNVAMRYRDGPLVLKGVSFEVNAKDKVGIAGRTGLVFIPLFSVCYILTHIFIV